MALAIIKSTFSNPLAFYDGNSTEILDTFPPYTSSIVSDRYVAWRTDDYAENTFVYDGTNTREFRCSIL